MGSFAILMLYMWQASSVVCVEVYMEVCIHVRCLEVVGESAQSDTGM